MYILNLSINTEIIFKEFQCMMICVSKMFKGFLLIGKCLYMYLQISEFVILKKKEEEMCAFFFFFTELSIYNVSKLHLARILLYMNFFG